MERNETAEGLETKCTVIRAIFRRDICQRREWNLLARLHSIFPVFFSFFSYPRSEILFIISVKPLIESREKLGQSAKYSIMDLIS